MGAFRVSSDSGIDMGIEGDEESMGLILVKDFDPQGVVFMIKEIDIFFDQFYGGFIDSAVQGDGSVTVNFTSCRVRKKSERFLGAGLRR